MFRDTRSGVERLRQIEYFKTLIKECFSILEAKENPGYILKDEVPTIIRYLGGFPSEAQLSNVIIPEMQEDEPTNYVHYDKFEKFMLNAIISEEFEPDDMETLLAAFRFFDQEGRGYIEIDVMKKILKENGIAFRDKEWDDFMAYSADLDTNVIYYEDYVSRLLSENDKHIQNLLKGLEKFKYP